MTNDKVDAAAPDGRQVMRAYDFDPSHLTMSMKVMHAALTMMVGTPRVRSPIRMALDLMIDATGWKTAAAAVREVGLPSAVYYMGVECKAPSLGNALTTEARLDAYRCLYGAADSFQSIAVIGCGGTGSDLAHALGGAFTMRVILEADDAETAAKAEKGLCVDLPAIVGPGCDMAEALAAIQLVLPAEDGPEHRTFRVHSASVCRGWSEKIADPSAYVASDDAEDEAWVTHDVVLADLGDFCASGFLDVWYGRVNSEWVLPAAVPRDEPEDDTEFGGDFYRADGLLGLWYGGSRRAKR